MTVWFSHVLRTFQGGAFQRNLLFRGAWACGDFYLVNPQKNIVLGPVVRDAARWYEAANWIGIHATPRAGLFVQSLIDRAKDPIDFVMVDYDVPLKDGKTCKMKAINWPKNLHLRYPDSDAQTIRGILQASLVVDPIRPGDEQKQFNALAFFDAVVKQQGFHESWRTRLTDQNAINPAANNPSKKLT